MYEKNVVWEDFVFPDVQFTCTETKWWHSFSFSKKKLKLFTLLGISVVGRLRWSSVNSYASMGGNMSNFLTVSMCLRQLLLLSNKPLLWHGTYSTIKFTYIAIAEKLYNTTTNLVS